MTFDQFSSSNGGSCDVEGIRRFWDGMLQRLKVHAETAELEAMYASGAERGSTPPIAGNERQARPGQPVPTINFVHEG